MDRFQRYALIFGPIIGAILFYLIFTTMSGRLQSDQQTLGDLGPVTLEEVSQNPALLTGEGQEEGVEDGEVVGEITVTEAEVETEAEVITATEAAVTDGVTDTLEVTAAITETQMITTEDEIVIATTVTQTEETLVEIAIAEDIVWFVDQYDNGEGELIDVVEDSAITLLLAGDTISGSTGCSNYAGRYTPNTEGESIVTLTAISAAGTETEECVDGGVRNAQEFEYFDALDSAVSFVIEGNQFLLSNSAGDVILIYTAAESN